MKEFKVGDKVTCLVSGKGLVISVTQNKTYNINVVFENGESEGFTNDGKLYDNGLITLYHGHGTFKIEFVEDKEPEYEWRYYSSSRDFNSPYYTDIEWTSYSNTLNNDWVKIEASKREAKR